MKAKIPLLILIVVSVAVGVWYLKSHNKGEGPKICAQVLTDARNPKTGEVKTFPTPCDVPEGWDHLERGGNDSYVQGGVTYQRYRNADLGISFAYRTAPDGLILVDENTTAENSPGLEKSISLFNQKDYSEVKASSVPREYPPAISIRIFDNKKNKTPENWLRDNVRAANYRPDQTKLNKAELGGVEGVEYKASGLYENDVFVLPNNYKIYIISGAYIAPGDPIRADFLNFIKTVTLF